MIRKSKSNTIETIVKRWIEASIKAHDFIPAEYWQSKVADMQNIYLPAPETHVYENNGIIDGFISIYESDVAAIFVRPLLQGKGIGSELIEFVKGKYEKLKSCVYKSNIKSIEFYKKHGFKEVCEQADKHTVCQKLK